jgi:hypothetical protein
VNVVTLGGTTLGVAILVLVGMRWWWQDKHQPAALAPFLLCLAYGMLAILSAGGLLGGLADVALWGSNGIGDLALVWGVGGDSPNVTRAGGSPLTDGGHAVVLLVTCVIVGLWKWARKIRTSTLSLGALAGISLGLNGSVAGLAAVPLASAVNLIGAGLTEIL